MNTPVSKGGRRLNRGKQDAPDSGKRSAASKGREKGERNEYVAAFAQRLKTLREQKGMSQVDVAGIIGVNPQTIVNYEGKRSLPDALIVRKLAACFEVDPALLVQPELQAPRIVEPFDTAISLLQSSRDLGLRGVSRARSVALESFLGYVSTEVNNIYVVGTSARGLLECRGMKEVLRERVQRGAVLRMVLSSPVFSFLREPIESRRDDAIESDIGETRRIIKEEVLGIKGDDAKAAQREFEHVRFFPGTPTVFLMATSSHMLLNPYTYGSVAYHMFCIEVEKRHSTECIYDAYLAHHFQRGWDKSISWGRAYADWEKLKGEDGWITKCREYLAGSKPSEDI